MREAFELRYGALWTGAPSIVIGDVVYPLDDVMHKIGFDGLRVIDAPVIEGRYAIRFLDGETWQIVCFELDEDFTILAEHRVHAHEWVGETE